MKTLFSAILFTTLLGGLAHAQKYEFGVSAGYSRFNRPALGSVSIVSPGDFDTTLKAQNSVGAWIGLNTRGYYGHEFNYQVTYAKVSSISRTTDENDVTTETTRRDRIAIHQAGYNFLIYFMPNGSHWRPFVTGGIQATQYQSPNIPGWSFGSNRKFGANYGGGIKLIPTAHTLFRLDVRDYIGGKPWDLTFSNTSTLTGGLIHQYEASAGFAITF